MATTGIDIKPLECLLFMRDVKSRNYFEQMKDRRTRTLDLDAPEKSHAIGQKREAPLHDCRRDRRDQVIKNRQPIVNHHAGRAG